MSAGITAFFDRYRAAFNALDAEAVSVHFALPSMLIDDQAYIWSTVDDLIANMGRLVALYRSQGFASASYEIVSTMPQGDDSVTANLLWTIARTGRPPWHFHTSYTLKRSGDDWKIVLCLAYEERAVRGSEA